MSPDLLKLTYLKLGGIMPSKIIKRTCLMASRSPRYFLLAAAAAADWCATLATARRLGSSCSSLLDTEDARPDRDMDTGTAMLALLLTLGWCSSRSEMC